MRKAVRWLLAALLALVVLLGAPHAARAQVEFGDLETSVRVLNFLKPVPSGTVVAAIVYPAGSPAGRVEAEHIAGLFNGSLRAGAATVRPVVVDADSLVKLSPSIVFLTSAALAQAGSIADRMAGRAALTIAFDPAPVEADLVVMAIRSSPRVEILLSRAAAQKAGVTFAPAFRMLVMEH